MRQRAAAVIAAVLIGVVVAVLAGAVLGVPAAAGTADRQIEPAAPGDAVENYGACLAARQSGDLLILIDESGSLRQSDPTGARVTAAIYLLRRLNGFVTTTGIELNVAVSGFSGDFAISTNWTSLNAGSLPALVGGVESYRTRTDGFETDYWSALEGARRALGDRAPGGVESSPCQAIAWFSDGELDIPARDTQAEQDRYGVTKPFAEGLDITSPAAAAQAGAAAAQSLCRPGGLADQLRASRVYTFAIGLAAGRVEPSDFDLMRSIATGEPTATGPCGNVVEPWPGEFELASDIDDLLFAFDALSTPGSPPLQQEEGICQSALSEICRHRFVLDSSIKKVHILGSVDAKGIQAQLILPSGAVVPLTEKTVGRITTLIQGGITIDYSWQSEETVSIDLGNAARSDQWSGAWALAFVDPSATTQNGVSRSNIHISGDLLPAWTNQGDTILHSGDRVPGVVLGVVDTDRAAVDPTTILGDLALTAVLTGRDGTATELAAGLDKSRLGAPVELDLTDVPPGAATLSLTLDVTTAAATGPDSSVVPGTKLAPQRVDLPVQVASPLNYPEVAPAISFGIVEGETERTEQLEVTGPGCVWVEGDTAARTTVAPQDAGKVAVTAPEARSAGTCLVVEEGAEAQLDLRMSTERVGNGTVTGSVLVLIAPIGEPDRAKTVDVAFSADLRKPLNAWNFWLALLAAVLLGPGIPIALLYAAKWMTARIPARSLMACRIPVTVEGSWVRLDGSDFLMHERDFSAMVPIPARGARQLIVAGVQLRSRTGRSPLGAGFVTAEVAGAASGMVAASSEVPAFRSGGRQALLPLAVHNRWVVLHHPAGPPDVAEVLLLVGGDTQPGQRADLFADVARRLPAVLARLREAAGGGAATAGPAPGHGPFGGGPGPFGGGPGPSGGGPFGGRAGGVPTPTVPRPPPGTRPFEFPDDGPGR